MKKTLELSTKESLFDPIEIKVDGKAYKSKPMTKQLIDEVLGDELQKQAREGKIEMLYAQVHLLYDIEDGIIESLDVRDVGRIVKYTMDQITSSTEEEPEKNPNGSGDKK